jgi:hypothetical protein
MPEQSPIDTKILELLATVRQATEAEQAAEARRLAEQTAVDINSPSLENLVASETLALKALMVAGTKRQQSFEAKRLNQRADRILSDFPFMDVSKDQAKKLLKLADKRRQLPWTIVSGDFITTESEGLPGEELTQSWSAELDNRPMPSRPEVADRARLRILCAVGRTALQERFAVPVYDITATRYKSGLHTAEVRDADEQLMGSDLFAPLGFVLAAQKQYEQ